MNDNNPDVFVYLLVDNGLLDEVSASYTEADPSDRPKWLAPIYARSALVVSPLLIDIEAAYDAGDLDRVMSYLNARTPALHVSIIETELELEKLAQHLSRFIFILTPEGKQLTLRYADCTVLAPLSTVLNAAQWRTMREPIKRWNVHDRSGNLYQLPPAESIAKAPTPIFLNDEQLAALDEASEPDHCIAKVKMMINSADLPGNSAECYAWALASRRTWQAAGNSNPLILMFLTEAALLTKGAILQSREIQSFLAMDEASSFRTKLHEQTAGLPR